MYEKISKVWFIGKYFRKLIIDHMIFIYDVTTSVIACIEDLHERSEDLPMDKEVILKILAEFSESKKEAHEHLNRLEQ